MLSIAAGAVDCDKRNFTVMERPRLLVAALDISLGIWDARLRRDGFDFPSDVVLELNAAVALLSFLAIDVEPFNGRCPANQISQKGLEPPTVS